MRRPYQFILLILMLLAPTLARAQERALHWDRYDYTVVVEPDGDLRFTERQVLIVDQGTFRTGSLGFTTGEFGRVRGVEVSENGQPYRPGADGPGTFAATDDGQRFQLTYVFRDPSATRHDLTIGYTVGRALVDEGDQAVLDWDFFCSTAGCPRIDAGAVEVRLPAFDASAPVTVDVQGAAVRQTGSGATRRWELTGPVQAQALELVTSFPRAALLGNATFRGAGNGLPQGQPGSSIPGAPAIAQPAPSFDPIFCFVVLFMLVFAFSIMRRSMARRPYMPQPTRLPPLGGGFGFPPMTPRRRRRYGGWGGGWGFPPITVIPPIHPRAHPRDNLGGPFDSPSPDPTPGGGGGMSWGDSGGGGTSWNNSSGGGSSWGNGGGGGSSWGGSGGSDRGGNRGGGGGGSDNSSSFR